ncbi:cell wall-associated NlpC family hydrolase [Amycolatopsis cihanbeyliensis]|uniref:Cell wall-associated NlpC family hydrolase n=1 Tax=Amycolatopsis cihanbeyliensis TaxID=1128664 RepID=A0A542CUH5_AMYCI|nr:cell wall-associated NlpC family hydrolase [Amycolatopsis cihanbeyliensis]
MTGPSYPDPVDSPEDVRQPGPRRRLYLALGAAVLVVAVFVLTLVYAPTGEDGGDTTTALANQQVSSTAPPPAPGPPVAPEQQGPPEPSGIEFEGWVDEVAGWLDIPRRAMHAYAAATVALGEEQPGCKLSWVTLAGIGKTTTDHGRVGGGQLGEDGRPSSPIGTTELRDVAGTVVSVPGSAGPLQLSPAVWREWGRSAGSGEPDVQNIDDAALTAGHALCAGGRNLDNGENWLAAVSSLQDAPLFLHRVLATANVYGTVGQNESPPNPAALRAVTFAIEKIGLPYIWGGNGKEKGDPGFDCSGLTTAAYASAGITLKRTAHWQYGSVPLVPADQKPRLGDLIFYGNPSTKIHHVGIYIGNRQMIDAPTFGQAVQVHNYRKPNDSYAGAGRPAN